MVLPTLVTFADMEARMEPALGVSQLSDVALHILQMLSPFAHTLSCTLGRTAPGPDGDFPREREREREREKRKGTWWAHTGVERLLPSNHPDCEVTPFQLNTIPCCARQCFSRRGVCSTQGRGSRGK